MKNVLIDTNIYSLAMKGQGEVVEALRKLYSMDKHFNLIPGLVQFREFE